MSDQEPTRREIMERAATAAVAIPLSGALALEAAPMKALAVHTSLELRLDVNGHSHKLAAEPRLTLLDALRESIGLTGTKKGCDHGQCGACTVLVNDRRVLSCLTLAASAEGARISTIEGLSDGANLHPLQAAFIKHDAFQCGYCTSGQIMSAVGLLLEAPPPDDDAIREGMAGNICRCGAYHGIVAAIREVRGDR